MPFCRRQAALALLALGAAAGAVSARAQYSTPIGTGVAKPKTLRATAVLEWTGSLERPSASRLMPLAVWDGEHYQPASLYLAHPAPLAVETGTQYELQRDGEPAGLFNVRGAAELHGEWIGLGSFHPQPAAAPPPKLKVSKHLPVLSGGKAEKSDSAGADDPGRPTLHRKTTNTADPPVTSKAPADTSPGQTAGSASSSTTPSTGTSTDADHPTLHRRTDTADSTAGTSTQTGAGTSASPTAGSEPTGSTTNPGSTGSSTASGTDPDRPTLHRKADADSDASTKAPDSDPDRPTVRKHSDTAGSTDPDRPTLHRARTGSEAATSIDPDRPRLRYGRSDDQEDSLAPVRLEGAPPAMQQLVAVSDPGPVDPRPYQYHWASPEEAAKMQAALALLAAQAIARPATAAAKPAACFGPASHPAKSPSGRQHSAAPAPALVDAQVSTYELTFSGGPTVVYSAHTADEGPARTYVTLIAQPDFSGKPQVLLQQVSRGDRLDEVPAMKLIDAMDTDGDQRAELIFQLDGATRPAVNADPAAPSEPAAAQPQPSAAMLAAQAAGPPQPERAFAIYRVGNGKAEQVFNTGPLP